MRITSIETIAYQNVTEVHSGGVGWLWVRIHTDSGHYGTGETFPPPDSEKAIILKDFAPVLLGVITRYRTIWLDLLTHIQ